MKKKDVLLKKVLPVLISVIFILSTAFPVHATSGHWDVNSEYEESLRMRSGNYEGEHHPGSRIGTLKGIAYHDAIPVAVQRYEQLNATFSFNRFDVENEQIILSANIYYNGVSHLINASGDVFYSVSFHLDNAMTVFFGTPENQMNERFIILGFIIEIDPCGNMLLPVNSSLTGHNVLTVAVYDTNTDILFHFEDSIPSYVMRRLERATPSIVEEKLSYHVRDSENWFIPLLPRHEIQADDVDTAYKFMAMLDAFDNVDKLSIEELERKAESAVTPSSLSELNEVTPLLTSPIPGVPVDRFRRAGSSFLDTNSSYIGYFRITNNWPLGTQNMLTEIIRWGYAANAPRSNGTIASFSVSVTHIGTFQFSAQANTITRTSNSAFLRLQGNPRIEAAILTANADLVTVVNRGTQARPIYFSVNWRPFISLLPFGSQISSALNILTAITRRDSVTTPTQTYPNTVAGQNSWFGGTNTVRGARVEAQNGYLRSVNDRVELHLTITRPTDRNVSGTRRIGVVYDFNVRTRNALGVWSTSLRNVRHNRTVSYSW